jgi:catalase
MQMMVHKGQVDYEPSLLDSDGPRASATAGYRSFAAPVEGVKERIRPDTFADHFSQARQFFHSQTEPEQNHIVAALTFELSKCEVKAVRLRVLGQLANIDTTLANRVAAGLGLQEKVPPVKAAVAPRTDLAPSPALSILAKAKPTLNGRMIGVLVSAGADAALVKTLIKDVHAEGGKVKIIAPTVGGVAGADAAPIEADFQLAGGPSVLFDAVAVVASKAGAAALAEEAAAVAFVHDAFQHLKAIGFTAEAQPLLDKAGVLPDAAVVELAAGKPAGFIKAASQGKLFDREPKVRSIF